MRILGRVRLADYLGGFPKYLVISFSCIQRGTFEKETFLGREVIDDENRETFLLLEINNLEHA